MGLEVLRDLVNKLRKKDKVVGVWTEITPGSGASVTTEIEGGTGRQVKIGETGKVDGVSHGKVIKVKVNRGRPNADTLYVASDGTETKLESREF